MTIQYIDLSERHGHRNDHGFPCGAEFNVKTRRRVNIPDFVREQLSESEIDRLWWEEAERSRDDLRDTLQKRYKWIGELAFVGRGPGWLAIEDTGCKPRNWDSIGKIVEKRLREFITSMESPTIWRDVRDVAPGNGARKKSPHALDHEIAEALSRTRSSPVHATKRRPVARSTKPSWTKHGAKLVSHDKRFAIMKEKKGGYNLIDLDTYNEYPASSLQQAKDKVVSVRSHRK